MTTPEDIETALTDDLEARPFWEAFCSMTSFPEKRRVELFRIFMSSRRETLRRAKAPTSEGWTGASSAKPRHVKPPTGTPEYEAWWRSFYQGADVKTVQETARRHLSTPYEEGV